eukprot:GHVQ01013170.1.p2 GENE.GHVQ01013170.1~~GHVQ01013170.1.p2  ORF type:complete len:366 (+),score=55.95 GHVQ01013170.1:1431-2528(+)
MQQRGCDEAPSAYIPHSDLDSSADVAAAAFGSTCAAVGKPPHHPCVNSGTVFRFHAADPEAPALSVNKQNVSSFCSPSQLSADSEARGSLPCIVVTPLIAIPCQSRMTDWCDLSSYMRNTTYGSPSSRSSRSPSPGFSSTFFRAAPLSCCGVTSSNSCSTTSLHLSEDMSLDLGPSLDDLLSDTTTIPPTATQTDSSVDCALLACSSTSISGSSEDTYGVVEGSGSTGNTNCSSDIHSPLSFLEVSSQGTAQFEQQSLQDTGAGRRTSDDTVSIAAKSPSYAPFNSEFHHPILSCGSSSETHHQDETYSLFTTGTSSVRPLSSFPFFSSLLLNNDLSLAGTGQKVLSPLLDHVPPSPFHSALYHM